MTPIEARKLWTDALRSGDYKQGIGCLRSNDDRYCCLGVACDVYQKHVGGLSVHIGGSGDWFYAKHGASLPTEVRKWLDVSNFGATDIVGSRNLAAMNDSGDYKFADIADSIDGGHLLFISQSEGFKGYDAD